MAIKVLHDIVRFESFDEFLQHVCDAPVTPAMRRAWAHSSEGELSSESTSRPDFYGTKTFDAAVKLAREGWSKGRADMSKSLAALAPYVQAAGQAPATQLDVAGYAPCVPAYCAGSPANMWAPGDTYASTARIVRICLSMSMVWSTPIDVIRNRGAAVLAAVEYLESLGLRCEIELAHCSEDSGSRYADADGKTVEHLGDRVKAINECYIPVKQANQSIELDRLAFMLGHASVLRRFVFRIDEQHVAAGPVMRGSYGMPTDITPDHDQVYLPAIVGRTDQYKYAAPETALKTVLGLISAKLSDDQQNKLSEDWRGFLTNTRI
jgi:hypothetical protein